MATKKVRKPRKPSAGERLTAIENAFVTALNGFTQVKQMLGTQAIEQLTVRVDQLEKLFKPEMERLLGELRAVRYLLDDKKQYAHMDKPRPELLIPPSLSGG
jgi:hypothetical protein